VEVAGMNWRHGVLLVGVVLVAGCGGPGQTGQGQGQGTVQGTFERVGGPITVTNGKAQTPTVPLSGTVTFTGGNGQKFSVSVGSSGTFSVQLAVGSYAVSGVSGQLGGGGLACSSPLNAGVRAGEISRILVVCPVP
jgi:hypothetical protein